VVVSVVVQLKLVPWIEGRLLLLLLLLPASSWRSSWCGSGGWLWFRRRSLVMYVRIFLLCPANAFRITWNGAENKNGVA
jgi:hypothetical protein